MQKGEKRTTEEWSRGKARRVHFMGVCGVGMAGVACLLHQCGWEVSGCDAKPNVGLRSWLEAGGITVAPSHDPAHIALFSPDALIVTPAVASHAPEKEEAQKRGVPVSPRGEVLASLFSETRGVAVCGSHGKTTTACFTTRLFQKLGAKPSWCIGGFTPRLGGVAGTPGAGPLFVGGTVPLLVAEADESDGTLALYHPAVTVVNTLDPDHLDHFKSEEELLDCFRHVVAQTREGVAVCSDSPRALMAASAHAPGIPLLRFGMREDAELRAGDVETRGGRISFLLSWQGHDYGRITLPFGGRHNVLNALAATAAALLAGYPPETIAAALPDACSELPGRRFETLAEIAGARIIADYAHHPAELHAAVEMALEQEPVRLTVVFQPHRYSRTKALGKDFPAAFRGANEIILLPVYAASEAPMEGGEICDLYEQFREQQTVPELRLARNIGEVWAYLRERLTQGEIVLLAGAGDIIAMAGLVREDAARGIHCTPPEGAAAFQSLAKKNFFGCGGDARWFVRVRNEDALAEVLRSCRQKGIPWRVLGAGANSWFSDLGESGCVIQLRTDGILRRGEDGVVEVPADMSGAALLDRCEKEGWTGLEFLESVPGSIGGWLAMNAGAHGGEIAERVVWIRCLNPDGEISILPSSECGFAYRHCKALATGKDGTPVALGCGIKLAAADPVVVHAKRAEIRAKRIPLAGLRTEGSVFRNPKALSAGKLLDAAGCKCLRMGGARVTDFHANVIAVDPDVTASDILALAMRMRGRVERASGIRLEPEITGLDF